MNNKKTIIIMIIFSIIFAVTGGTFAYLSWETSAAQQTAVTFTVSAGYSCSADGGGNITSEEKMLAPASCTNSTYAIQRTVTVGPTITQSYTDVYLDLWLKVSSIGSGLAASQNFKYALTTSPSNCTTGVVAQGNFNGATTNTQKTLLHNKLYSQTTTDTYYLWIWLDVAETNSATQNQNFSIELGGLCTNQAPSEQTIYTANLYDDYATNRNSVMIGSPVPNNITQYGTPDEAMAALKTAGDGTTDYPFFLKHTTESDTVTESYVGFVVTPAMASAYPGMTAGTYYLRGDDMYYYDSTEDDWFCKSEYIDSETGNCMTSQYYVDNKATLLSAFGSTYCDDYSSSFECRVSGLRARADASGLFEAGDGAVSRCRVDDYGFSNCRVDGGLPC